MKFYKQLFAILALLVVATYLFVTAPPPLPEPGIARGERLPVKVLFDALAAEQDAARSIFTAEIVGPGLRAGLRFTEDWKDAAVQAGPLPALLLREVSVRLQQQNSEVGLFLGSDFPIAPPNRLNATQAARFASMKADGKPAYFFDTSNSMQTAMYVDRASAQPCVTCHNEHADSTKKDWKLNDPMGATTWLYPHATVTAQEVLAKVAVLRRSVRQAYQAYLNKASGFSKPALGIGSKWPREGLFLPDADTFMAAVSRRASEQTLSGLIQASQVATDAVSAR